MKKPRILLLDPAGLVAYRCDGRVCEVEDVFDDASEAFGAYLTSHPSEAFALLVNLPEESFEPETVPHVWWGRAAMLARKRARHGRGSPFCIAVPQGRLPSGRRDDRFLFAALTSARTVAPWLRRIEDAKSALRGIYSVPQMAPRLAKDAGDEPIILATATRAGLRQTLLTNGQLRFSRLTSLPADKDAAAACALEAVNLRRYLSAQRLIERDAPLQLRVLAGSAHLEDFRRHCRQTDELSFEVIALEEEAGRRGLDLPFDGSGSDVLFAHLLACSPPVGQFAPAETTRYWRAAAYRRVLDGIGAAAAAAALLNAALVLPDSLRLSQSTAQLRAANDADQRAALPEAKTNEVPAGISSRELRDLGVARSALARFTPGPGPLLGRLGRALDEIGPIELEAIDWRISEEFESERGPFAVLEVSGMTRDADPRARSEQIRLLGDRLGAEPGIRVVLGAAASSEQGRRDDGSAGQAFVMRVGHRL